MMIAAEWGVGQVLWSMLWFFMFVIWIWMIIVIFSDIFRSEDLSGGSQGHLVDLHHLPTVPRHLRLPHRSGWPDVRTIRQGSSGRQPGDAGLHS